MVKAVYKWSLEYNDRKAGKFIASLGKLSSGPLDGTYDRTSIKQELLKIKEMIENSQNSYLYQEHIQMEIYTNETLVELLKHEISYLE